MSVGESRSPLSLAAPGKVNLTLDVFPPRPDGYHDLDSIVVPLVSPADDVTLTLRPGAAAITLIAKHAPEGFPKGPENLAYRAAALYRERYGIDGRIFIKLDKRLPLQAGLGGGSSDAASVLLALHRITGASDPASLTELAAMLGSDVPLFLSQSPVRMRGRGEWISPLPHPIPPLWGVLARPSIGVPTGPAYAALDALPCRTPGSATTRLLEALAEGANVQTLAPLLSNDFEQAILPAYPEVADAYEKITEAGALRTLLCGSGSALFGLAESREHARTLVKTLVGQIPWVRLAATTL